MMFGATSGVGFGGTINYDIDSDGRHDKDARILEAEGVDVFFNAEGQLDADPRQLARSFRAQAMMNPDVSKCVKHLWVSYRPEDLLAMVNNELKGKQHFQTFDEAIEVLGQQRINEITDTAMVEDAKQLLTGLKYSQTQYLIVRHSEKDNPHVHVILNMVDNEGNRINDFQDKKRGIKICRKITLDRSYSWGAHKSVSKVISHNPKDNAHAEICRTVFMITKTIHTAKELQTLAAKHGIGVKFSTDFLTGEIKGISYEKDGYRFPASRIDRSISAKKLFPAQEKSNIPLSMLPEEVQRIVKDGGIVPRFNDQKIQPARIPEPPQSVTETRIREEYHAAITEAEKTGSRTAYMYNIAGLALDPNCGPSMKRAEAVSPYIIDENTNQTVEIQRIQEIIQDEDELAQERKSIFQRFLHFLRSLMKESLNIKKHSIVTEKGREKIQWDDLRESVPGKVVGLARVIPASIEQAYNAYLDKRGHNPKTAHETTKRQDSTQGQIQTHGQTVSPSHQGQSRNEKKTIIKL